MAKLILKEVTALCGGKFKKVNILIEKGIISRITTRPLDLFDAEVIEGGFAVSGYVDIHTHGGNGFDTMDKDENALANFARYQLFQGVTTFLPTTVTASLDALQEVFDYARIDQPYAKIRGLHLEGPFLSPIAKGAHKEENLLAISDYALRFVEKNADIIKRITFAPDLENSAKLCEILTNVGIKVSAGHDNSTKADIVACKEKGLDSVTHLFNQSSTAKRPDGVQKEVGLTEYALWDKDFYCEIICDGVHVPYEMIEMAYKCKGSDKLVMVSDSLSVASSTDTELYLGSKEDGQKVKIEKGVCLLENGKVAGSITSISQGVEKLLQNTSIPFEDILKMATLNPCKLMGWDDIGDIKKGMCADINILDEKGKILHTIFNGRVIV